MPFSASLFWRVRALAALVNTPAWTMKPLPAVLDALPSWGDEAGGADNLTAGSPGFVIAWSDIGVDFSMAEAGGTFFPDESGGTALALGGEEGNS